MIRHSFIRTNSSAAFNIASYKRGTGGRSSFSGQVVTIFGASGFLGRMLVNRLGRAGAQIIIPYRCSTYYVDSLKLCGGLGQILFQPFHLQDEQSIESAVKYSNVVVNLIGRDFETSNFSFEQVHCEGARRIARISKELGVQNLIHVSSLNSSCKPTPYILQGGSKFLQTKAMSEDAVVSEFPTATIVRPSDIAGFSDRFLFYFAEKYRRTLSGSVPLWHGGRATVKQPVLAFDVVSALVELIENPIGNQIVELAGPERYRLDELVRFILQTVEVWHSPITDLNWSFKYKMRLIELLKPVTRLYSIDKLERECTSDCLTGRSSFEDLGIVPGSVLELAAHYLRPCIKDVNAKRYPYVFKQPDMPTPL